MSKVLSVAAFACMALAACSRAPPPIACRTVFDPDLFASDAEAQVYLAAAIPVGSPQSCVDQVLASPKMIRQRPDVRPATQVYRERRWTDPETGAGLALNSRIVVITLANSRVTAVRVN